MNTKNKKTHYYILTFVSLFLLLVTMFYFVYATHRDTVVKQQKDQLGVLATTGANYIESYLIEKNYELENVFTIARYGNSEKEINQKMEEKIKLYWSIALTYLDYLEYFPVSDLTADKIAGITEDELYTYQKEALKSNELVIGPWVNVNTDSSGIYLFKGVFDENGKHGLLVGRIDMKMAFKKTIGQMPVGKDGYFTVGDIDNYRLLKGNTPFYQTNRVHEESKNNNTPILNGYSFLSFGPHNLLVSAAIPYYEIHQPIKLTFYFLTGLSIGLFLLFAYITYTLVRMNKEKVEHTVGLRYQEELHRLNKNATLGIFSREIAHEYNNLLTPIQIYCELLEGELQDSEELLDYAGEIGQAVNQCKLLANRLLTFGRNQTLRSNAEVFDSGTILKSSLKQLRSLIPQTITLNAVLPSEPVLLKGEPLELVQILFNLSMNSIQAMEPDGGTLSIEYHIEGNNSILTVTDSGKGMSDETKRQLFTSGFTTKGSGGNGLGLAIVSKLVENFTGTITFTSQYNVGTTFTLKFPLTTMSNS